MNFKKFKHIWEKNSARILRFGYRKGKKKSRTETQKIKLMRANEALTEPDAEKVSLCAAS